MISFNIDPYVIIRKLTYDVTQRIYSCYNLIVKRIVDSMYFNTSNIYKQWHNILFNRWCHYVLVIYNCLYCFYVLCIHMHLFTSVLYKILISQKNTQKLFCLSIGWVSDCETHVVEMFITIFSAIFTGFPLSYRHTHKAGFYFQFVWCKPAYGYIMVLIFCSKL